MSFLFGCAGGGGDGVRGGCGSVSRLRETKTMHLLAHRMLSAVNRIGRVAESLAVQVLVALIKTFDYPGARNF